MMILSLNAHHLNPVEKYLSRRDYELVVNSDVKSFVVKAVQWQPDFVLVPVDHPHPNVSQLPKILNQVLTSVVFIYASQNTSASIMRLKKVGDAHHILPPITGPKVERTLKKYFLELNAVDKNSPLKRESKGQDQENELMIKIEGNKSDLLKFSVDQKINLALAAMTGGMPLDTGPDENDIFSAPSSFDQSNTSEGGLTYSETAENPKNLEEVSKKKTPALSLANRESIAKSFEESLRQIDIPDQKSKVFKIINQVTSASCFSLACESFKGYAIVVSATNNHKDHSLTQTVKNKLNEFFRAQNIEIETFGAIEIKKVEFQPWAFSQAEVLEKAHTNGEEFAIAFFPQDEIEPMFQPSDDEKMVSLHMDEMHGNVNTEFDLYLRFRKNNKFVLYTPKNRRFLQEQRDRLILNGITEMYLKPDDKKFVYRYRAQNFLNHEIDKFLEYAEQRKRRKVS
ncbi:MAG: hypothetical protein ACK5WZ_06460 [Pseudobdellovibrionaceae bacterium]